MTMSQSTVMKLYTTVVDDVIAGVRDCFLDDGVDEQVLQELKQLWKSKLQASGAMDPPQPEPAMPPPPVLQNFQKANGNNVIPKRTDTHMAQQGSSQTSGVEHGPPVNIPGSHPHHVLDPNNRVPVQLTLPAQPGVPGSQPRSFTIQIPASALNGNKLHQVLTGPIINATISLPQPLAATLLQQHINSALAGQQNEFDGGGGGRSGAAPFISLDGALDSSDDEGSNVGDGSEEGGGDDDDDDDSPDDPAEEEEEERDDSGGAEEEPLNSGDDVSDEEPGDMFDTDNVVVCQYDKITRSRNKWKFYLKDGIMNLGGKDYVFQKANGDAEW
ncbi:transcription factor IIA, alpha/beta subunit domain-containing protein [Phthorimaea operculella]|nr:transcription factor IIA, alpha/beta subunit domain-containing protein [Phthorimaea operculella]